MTERFVDMFCLVLRSDGATVYQHGFHLAQLAAVFFLHHEEMIGAFRSIVDVRGRAGWGGKKISIHGQMLCQEHHPSKKRTVKICI